MIALEQRLSVLAMVDAAVADGARRANACAVLGLTLRSVQRWHVGVHNCATCRVDGRPARVQYPANRFSASEQAALLAAANEAEFGDLPPSQIVPRLADAGRYLGSESTLYRYLRAAKQTTHRRPERHAQPRGKPRALSATAVDQVVSWDITYLHTLIHGIYLYLYVFMDVFSRKIVAWQVFEQESQVHASALFHDYVTQAGIAPGQLTLHSDNGAPMKGATLIATLQQLGVARSLSRPAVSNDNPYSEALFRTLKYRPDFPVEPFADVVTARAFIDRLVRWYNHDHRHSAITFVTPAQRHVGVDQALLDQRHTLYQTARTNHPTRWSGDTRKWHRPERVVLNPETAKKGAAE